MSNNTTAIQNPIAEYNKFFPPTFSLETPRVILRLLDPSDLPHLSLLTKNKEIWAYFTKDLSDDLSLEQWIAEALEDRRIGKRMPFTIIDRDTKIISGTTSYGNISFPDKRLEIGWTWLGTAHMGTGVNRHAKFAMLSFVLEVMKMERVEVKTDNLNERAKKALLKVGMKPEGVLRSHMQMHSNRRRDSIYYSIIKEEWEEVKALFFGDLI